MPPKTAKGRGRKRKAEAESATAPSLDKAESNNLQQVLVPAESACSSEERIDSPTAVAPCSVLETEKKDSRGSSSVELYDDQKVIRIFQNELQKEGKDRIKFYESSGYFENILWSSFSSSVCVEHVLSMVIILNEKCRIGVNPFALLAESTLKCNEFFEYLADIAINDRMDDASQLCAYIVFFINTFQNLENSVVRQCCLKYLAIPMWKSLSSARLEEELAKSSQLRKQWESLEKLKSGISTQKVATPRRKGKGKKSVEADVSASNPDPKVLKALERQEKWLPSLLVSFFSILSLKKGAKSSATKFIEKFVELMIDLLSQLSTRRFSRAVLQEFHFIERCRLHFSEDAEFSNFRALVLMAETYLQFAVDDHTGKALTAQEIVELHNEKVFKLQKIAFTDYADKLKDVVFSSVGELCKQQNLLKYLNLVSDEEVYRICEKMSIVTDHSKDPIASKDVDYWKMLLVDCVAVRPSVLDSIHMLPLYPTEKLLWDSSLIPLSANYNEEDGLALPKLNLQFLTIHDYLLRNFNLFRLESAYEIREDLVDAIKRMGPKQASVATPVTFSGWARMALPTISVNIDEVFSIFILLYLS